MKEYKKLCADCACLIEKKGVWCCDECFGQKCEDLDECPEGMTLEILEEAYNVKAPSLGAKSETKKERKPREKKIDADKVELITRLRNCLNIYTTENGGVSELVVTNEQREISFTYGGDKYSITLTKHRPPKA